MAVGCPKEKPSALATLLISTMSLNALSHQAYIAQIQSE